MKRLFFWIFFCLSVISIYPAGYTPDNLPLVYLQDRTRHVTNPDGILSPATVAAMDTLLAQLEQQKGVQSVVAVVKQIEGGDCYEFGMELARKYGIGNRQNTGLIILLSTEDRCYQILTGTGLEGTLPDAICRRIENRKMVPYLKEGQWDRAMLETVRSVCGIIQQDPALVHEFQQEENNGLSPILILFIIGCCAFFLISWQANRQRKTCPYCGKTGLVRVDSQCLVDRINRIEHHEEIWKCPHCGKLTKRTHDEPMDNGTGFGGMVPPIMGPWGGFRRNSGWGDGPQGGEFGGGDFGGGGSGGRF